MKRDIVDVSKFASISELFANLNALNGVILGTVNLQDCRRAVQADRASACCDVPQAAWAWVLDNPQPLDQPFPWRGRLGLCSMPWPEGVGHRLP